MSYFNFFSIMAVYLIFFTHSPWNTDTKLVPDDIVIILCLENLSPSDELLWVLVVLSCPFPYL